jgi:hypothetical protein
MEDVAKRVSLWIYSHRRFQEWTVSKVFQRLWIRLLEVYDDLRGNRWNWQSLDSVSVKAPLGGTRQVGPNPTDRGKIGTKRHVLTYRPTWHSVVCCHYVCKYA